MPQLIRFSDPTMFAQLHKLYHMQRVSFLVMQRPDGTQAQGDIVACHPELCGFSVVVNSTKE